MSDLTSTIQEKKRLIIKNPDGSLFYCNKLGQRDTALIKVSLNPSEIIQNQQMFPDNFTISDEDLQYIIENHQQFDNSTLLEHIVSIFRRNQLLFCLLFMIEMSLCSMLFLVTWRKKEYSIVMMQNLYKDLDHYQASLLFYGIFFINLVMNIVLYPLGFYSLVSKKIQVMKYFSTLCLYTSLSSIFIVYLNVLILYGYSRLLLNLLVSLLMLHRSMFSNIYSRNNNLVNNVQYNSI